VVFFFEDYAFDTARRELRRGEKLVPIEPQIFDLIAHLVTNRDRVVSKEDLLATVWKGRIISESTLSSSINAARTAIGDNGEDQRLIRTLPRKGFRFVGAVTGAAVPTADAVPSSDEQPGERRSAEPAISPASGPSSHRPGPLSRKTLVIATGIGLASVAAAIVVLLWPSADPARRPGTIAARPTFDASIVPIVDNEARRDLASYPSRPDFKALAITGEGLAVADGHSNAEAARQDALQRCNERTKRNCRLYAVGMDVVWSPEALPLPAPSDLRLEPLGIPLVPEEIPTLDRERRNRIAQMHLRAPDHRTLAVTARGHWAINSRATRAEAVRLAVERCGEYWQRPCLILAVDGLLTIQIPKSRQAIHIFLPSRDAELAGNDRERIGRIYQGAEWRALARGRDGSWHAIAGAASEEAAVAGALQSCTQAAQDCRLYAIGNFRVLGD
jgi:DNA-binding winged helix-turn-helix (wHTH) protein